MDVPHAAHTRRLVVGAAVTAPTRNRTAESGDRYCLEFDMRSDGGPRLVGPFDTRGQAAAYARDLHLEEAVFSVCPIKSPTHGFGHYEDVAVIEAHRVLPELWKGNS